MCQNFWVGYGRSILSCILLVNLKLDITEVEDTSNQPEHSVFLFSRKFQDVHRVLNFFEVLLIADSIYIRYSTLRIQVEEVRSL